MGPFVATVQTQHLPEGTAAEVHELQRQLSRFVTTNRSATLRARAVILVIVAIVLAFVASRVDQPLVVGLCGVVLIAPVVWIGTAIVVPLVLMARGKLTAGVSLQSGVEVSIDEQGLAWMGSAVPWSAVSSVGEEGDRVHLRGADPSSRRLFEVVLEASNFASAQARAEVVRELERHRSSAPPTSR